MNEQNLKQKKRGIIIAIVVVLAVAAIALVAINLLGGGWPLKGALIDTSKDATLKEVVTVDESKVAIDTKVTGRQDLLKKVNDSLINKNPNAIKSVKEELTNDTVAQEIVLQAEDNIASVPAETLAVVETLNVTTITEADLTSKAVVGTYTIDESVSVDTTTTEAVTFIAEGSFVDNPMDLGEMAMYFPQDNLDLEFVATYDDGTKSSITGQFQGAGVYLFKNPTPTKKIVSAGLVDKGIDKAIVDQGDLLFIKDSTGNEIFTKEAI
jgi:hypothetical protein